MKDLLRRAKKKLKEKRIMIASLDYNEEATRSAESKNISCQNNDIYPIQNDQPVLNDLLIPPNDQPPLEEILNDNNPILASARSLDVPVKPELESDPATQQMAESAVDAAALPPVDGDSNVNNNQDNLYFDDVNEIGKPGDTYREDIHENNQDNIYFDDIYEIGKPGDTYQKDMYDNNDNYHGQNIDIKTLQEKNVALMIKIKNLERLIDHVSRFKTIINFSTPKNETGDNNADINMELSWLPEYEIYFECFGYPTSPHDFLKIDQSQLNMIRKELEHKKINN